MKKIIYLIFLLFLITGYAVKAETLHVFYIDSDISDVDNRDSVELLMDKVKQVWGQAGDNVLLFISNDQRPVITYYTSEFLTKLNQLFYIKPAMPFSMVDVDTLNTLITQKGNITDEIVFHFFMNKCRYQQNNQEQMIIDRILLCNDLLSRNGLSTNCKVNIYFPKTSVEKCPQTNPDNLILKNKRTYETILY